MKKLLGFLFGYGQLGWKTRLTQPDHLYHQGRNALSLVLCAFYGVLLSSVLTSAPVVGFMVDKPHYLGYAMVAAGLFVCWLPLVYVAFCAFKLTVLRLHDFNRTGWWILAFAALGFIDATVSHLIPNLQIFFSLQNLAYLTLLILPAAAASNRFGEAATNSTAGKPRWVRAVPLVLFVLFWVGGMANAFVTNHMIQSFEATRPQTTANDGGLAEMQEFLRQQQAEQAARSEAQGISPTQVSGTVPATVSSTVNQ